MLPELRPHSEDCGWNRWWRTCLARTRLWVDYHTSKPKQKPNGILRNYSSSSIDTRPMEQNKATNQEHRAEKEQNGVISVD